MAAGIGPRRRRTGSTPPRRRADATRSLRESQLQELLPPTSNLVRFQKEVYLLPYLTDDLSLFHAIFGGVPEDSTKAPRETTLQRALLDRLDAGEHLHASAGACFLLPEDFDWGGQVYLRQAFPW